MTAMKWIKLASTLFEDEKMLLLEQLKNGRDLQLLWVKLLCLAGKQGREGVLVLQEGVPYTPRMLSEILRLDESLVKKGLKAFSQFGMLTKKEGAWAITNWARYQSLTAYEKKLAYDRDYSSKHRKPQPKNTFLDLAKEEL